MARPNYKIEYSKDGRVRVSNAEFETEWLNKPADGQLLVTLGGDEECEVVLATFDNYDGDLDIDTVYPLAEAEETEVLEDVDPDEEGEDESGDDDGSEPSDDADADDTGEEDDDEDEPKEL